VAPAQEAENGWAEELKITSSSIKVAAKAHTAYKKVRKDGGVLRVLEKPVGEDLPFGKIVTFSRSPGQIIPFPSVRDR